MDVEKFLMQNFLMHFLSKFSLRFNFYSTFCMNFGFECFIPHFYKKFLLLNDISVKIKSYLSSIKID